MNMEIKNFIKKYREKIELDNKRKEFEEKRKDDVHYMPNPYPFIRFYIGCEARHLYSFSHFPSYNSIIELDNEDLEYLYSKYSKKLLEELDSNIEDIKNKYKELL